MNIRNLLVKDAKNLQKLFLNEEDFTDVGINVTRDKITLNFTISWLRDHIKKYQLKTPKFIIYAIVNEKNEIIGTIGMGKIDYKNKTAEMGTWIAKKYTGKGYGTLATKLFLDKIQKKFNLKTIIGVVSKNNVPSYKVLFKNGFKLKKELKSDFIYEKELI